MDYRPPATLNTLGTLIRGRTWPWLLIGLLALTLFPFGWLGEVWPLFGAIIGWVFASTLAHAIGHAVIFCLLGATLLQLYPTLLAHPWRYCCLMLLAGLAQEAFQLLYKQRPLAYDDFRDLAVDTAAFLTIFALFWTWRRVRRDRAG